MPGLLPFKLERFFAEYEFNCRYLLSASDCESIRMSELVAMADTECRALWEGLALGYTESLGHPLLRAEVAHLHQKLTPDDILILAPQEGILTVMQTLLGPGDHVIAMFPAYQSLYEVARSMSCDVSLWMLQVKGQRWQLDLDQLEDLINEKTRLIVVNFPHNPTGYLATHSEFEQIVDLAARHAIYVLSDEMYRFLEYDPVLRLPPMADLYPKSISLSGLSKSFALPGLRIGWLATQDRDLYQKFGQFKDYTTICSSAPSEILGIIALRSAATLTRHSLDIVSQNLEIANRFFTRFKSIFNWLRPQAGSIAFPQLILDTPVEEFCRKIYERRSIVLVPGSIFDYPGNHFRLGLGRKTFSEGMEQLSDYLAEIC